MKISVVGAGPAGSVAAVSALRKGHLVHVWEEHGRAGEPRHCSGLVSREGLESLSDIADYSRHVVNRISCAEFDFAGEKFTIDRKAETACVIDRAAFDAELAQRAEEEGAKISYGQRFSGWDSPGDAIIGADGALSAVAHHYGFPKIGKFAFTLKSMAKLNLEETHKVLLFYDSARFPGFFGWLVPHDECNAEIGMGTTEPAFMGAGFEFMLEKTRPLSYEKPAAKVIPIEPRRKIGGTFGKTRVLLTGDAAGQVKASSGGGVAMGTAGARLAGALAHDPSAYENAWMGEAGDDLLAHVFLQNFFAAQPNPALRLTSLASKWLGLDCLFSLHGNMDRPTRFFRSLAAKAFNTPPTINNVGEAVGAEDA